MIFIIIIQAIIISWVGDKYINIYYRNMSLDAENLSLKLQIVTMKAEKALEKIK